MERTMLAEAILIAAQAHLGQKDKYGAPYILHPLRMMLRLKSGAEMIVAILHDVVEDNPVVRVPFLRNTQYATRVVIIKSQER